MLQGQSQGGSEPHVLSKSPAPSAPQRFPFCRPSLSSASCPLCPPLGLPWQPSVLLIMHQTLLTNLPLLSAAVDPKASAEHFLGASSQRTSW